MRQWLRLLLILLPPASTMCVLPEPVGRQGSRELGVRSDRCAEGAWEEAPFLLQRAARRGARAGSPSATSAALRRPTGSAGVEAPRSRWARAPGARGVSSALAEGPTSGPPLLFAQTFSAGPGAGPRPWSARGFDDEVLLVCAAGLTATGLFLAGIVAFQRGHDLAAWLQGEQGHDLAAWSASVANQQGRDPAAPPRPGEAPPGIEGQLASKDLFQLCESLVVPDRKRLVCRIPRMLRRERQSIAFDITSAPSRGQRPLMRVRAAETDGSASRPRILIEHPKDGDPLAVVATDDLYTTGLAEEERALSVLSASQFCFGAIQRRSREYLLTRTDGSFIKFSGHFRRHDVHVRYGGRTIANVEPVDDGAYQVSIESGVDAGLVLLGLLAIDKSETPPAGAPQGWISLNFFRVHGQSAT
uniref:Uncharacterized protein n=1 Tax=Alexandrium monilatum TaxID=311494 RepID=A0A7S4WFE3_9DINO|mmetsp:Transcript_50444/g.156391  ORF Transcript_50444/g.156391 Transcript_50444/m.156391 type:complete len:416 (-) Transcript_50444:343-1590(-)